MLQGQQLEADQRDGEERMHRRREKCGNREGKGKIDRPKVRWWNNTKIDLNYVVCVCDVNMNHLFNVGQKEVNTIRIN